MQNIKSIKGFFKNIHSSTRDELKNIISLDIFINSIEDVGYKLSSK